MPHKVANILVVHSYDFIDELGGAGSKARIWTACKHMRRGDIPHDVLMLWPQGYGKNRPTERLMRQISLGKNLADYSRKQRELSRANIVSRPMSWGTRGDMESCYKLAAEHYPDTKLHFHFVTDPVHMRRVKLVWELTHPEEWEASFYTASNHKLSFVERWLREPIAWLVYAASLSWKLITEGRPLAQSFDRALV